MRKIHVLLSFWKNFLMLILIESSLDSWILSLESWSWFLELESWNFILDSWNQISFWTLKCSWFNLELILWFLRSSSLLSWGILDFWAFCHHLCYHQNSLNQAWFIMKLAYLCYHQNSLNQSWFIMKLASTHMLVASLNWIWRNL